MCPDAKTKSVEAGSWNQRDTYGRGQGKEAAAVDKFIGAHMQGQRKAAIESQTLEFGIKFTNKIIHT